MLLEGPLGAGKSTFARFLLEALGADRPSEGSPTFSLVHLYPLRGGVIQGAHLDLYRLKSEEEIEEAGLLDYLWDEEGIALVEWLSLWPGLEARLWGELSKAERNRVWKVALDFVSNEQALRQVRVEIRQPA